MHAGTRSLIFILFLLVIAAISGTLARPETRFAQQDNRLFLLGTFDEQTRESVLWYLNKYPRIDTLVFTANGGSVNDDAVLSLGREIRQRGLRTHLIGEGVLASGGLSLFLAGRERSHDGAALIGVHGWQHCYGSETSQTCREAKDFPADDPAHNLHRDYNRDMLGSDYFYRFTIQAAPANAIHWMTAAEIQRYGLFTAKAADSIEKNHRNPFPNPFGSAFDQEKERVCGACPLPAE